MSLKNVVVTLSLSLSFLAFGSSARAAGITVGQDYFMTVEPTPPGENKGYYVGDTTIASRPRWHQRCDLHRYKPSASTFATKSGAPTLTKSCARGWVGLPLRLQHPPRYGALSDPTTGTRIEDALGAQFDTDHHESISNDQETIWDNSGAHYSDDFNPGRGKRHSYEDANYGTIGAGSDAIEFLELPTAQKTIGGRLLDIKMTGRAFMEDTRGVQAKPASGHS